MNRLQGSADGGLAVSDYEGLDATDDRPDRRPGEMVRSGQGLRLHRARRPRPDRGQGRPAAHQQPAGRRLGRAPPRARRSTATARGGPRAGRWSRSTTWARATRRGPGASRQATKACVADPRSIREPLAAASRREPGDRHGQMVQSHQGLRIRGARRPIRAISSSISRPCVAADWRIWSRAKRSRCASPKVPRALWSRKSDRAADRRPERAVMLSRRLSHRPGSGAGPGPVGLRQILRAGRRGRPAAGGR